MLRFCFSLPLFLIQNDTGDVHREQCFQVNPHTCAQNLFSFLALHWLPQLSYPPQECDWMQRRHQPWICHKMCLQTMAKDKDLIQNLVKADDALQSPPWTESTHPSCHEFTLAFLICKVMVHVFWELNYCTPSAEYLYLFWKSVSE